MVQCSKLLLKLSILLLVVASLQAFEHVPIDSFLRIPDLTAHDRTQKGFHLQLKSNLTLAPTGDTILQHYNYKVATEEWKHLRGNPVRNGNFTYPSGIYFLSVHIQLAQPAGSHSSDPTPSTVRQMTAKICIDDDCENGKSALQTTTGITNEQGTIAVVGVLEVKNGQRLIVQVENNTNKGFLILRESFFSGFLLQPL